MLDFTEVGDNVVNLIEVFVPFLDLVFEGGEVAGTKHGSDFGLVFFKHLKVLLTESGGEIFGIFMFLEIEFDILPGLSEFLECLSEYWVQKVQLEIHVRASGAGDEERRVFILLFVDVRDVVLDDALVGDADFGRQFAQFRDDVFF